MTKLTEGSNESENRAAGVDERLGLVTGDRRCHACGFNLRGQVVVREPHYQMIIVMCPECGTPSPLLEYPRLSPWTRRLAAAAAVGWLAMVTFLMLFVGGLMWMRGYSASRAAASPLAAVIAEDFIAYAKLQAPSAGPAAANTYQWLTTQVAGDQTWIDQSWWATEKKLNWLGRVSPQTTWFGTTVAAEWLNAFVSIFPLSAVIACVLPHWRRRTLLLVPVVGLAAAGVIFLFWYWRIAPVGRGGYFNSLDLAMRVMPRGLVVLQAGVMVSMVLAGVMTGRPLARWLIRWLVPPRQYVAFGFLSAADGLPMPKG